LRVDVNVSVCRHGSADLGIRTEVKNLSSLNSVSRAIEYEAHRQITTLRNGGTIVNETRGYSDEAKATVPMRDKEEKQDYRLMERFVQLKLRNFSVLSPTTEFRPI
jgi:aspartyl-tRNA(Asn)/glutamyl-tRNA(Gln) amidotransferase subunit B